MHSRLLRRSVAALATTALWTTLAPATGPAAAAPADDGWSPAETIATERHHRHIRFPASAVNSSGAALVAWRCSGPEGLALCARTRSTDGSWGSAKRVAEPGELAGRQAPRVVLDEAGVGTVVWVKPTGEAVARRVLPDGAPGETYSIASGLPRGSGAFALAPAADGALLLTWWTPEGDEDDESGDPVRVLSADGSLSAVHELVAGSFGHALATPTGWAMLSLDGSRYQLTKIAADGTPGAPMPIGAAGRGKMVGFGDSELVLGPEGELTAVWLRKRQGRLLTRTTPADGEPGPVTTVAEDLDEPRWLTAGRTTSGRVLVTFTQPADRGRDHLFGLRLPTADDAGTAPSRIGRMSLPLSVVAGDVTHFMGWRGAGSTVVAWTWDGEGRLSESRELMSSPFGNREIAYGAGYTATGSTLEVLGFWTRSGKGDRKVTRIASAVWQGGEAPDGPVTPTSSSRVATGGR